MHIVARARAFVESLRAMGRRTESERRRCRACGSDHVYRHGFYTRYPCDVTGRQAVAVQRYHCQDCGATHSDEDPNLIPWGRYTRAVRRCAMDQWLHTGSSLRRTAEWLRSWIGHQERWEIWHPLPCAEPERPVCTLCASTVHYWLNEAGVQAERQVVGLHEGLTGSGLLGADGLWTRLRGGVVRVLLMLRDSVTGLLWPPVVAVGEEAAEAWATLFVQARQAGLDLAGLLAVVSDGAQGLLSYLRQSLPGVYQQRCVFHLWRNLGAELARQAAQAAAGRTGEEARAARQRVAEELVALVHGVLDAADGEAAEEALVQLRAHPGGAGLWRVLNQRLIELQTHTMAAHQGLGRVTPEWMWRDFRLRLSRGRNHGSAERLRRAGLVFAIYRNFTPAQWRQERRRHYRHPGQSALEVTGAAPQGCSYLDALQV